LPEAPLLPSRLAAADPGDLIRRRHSPEAPALPTTARPAERAASDRSGRDDTGRDDPARLCGADETGRHAHAGNARADETTTLGSLLEVSDQ
jgi:hypothetical protein